MALLGSLACPEPVVQRPRPREGSPGSVREQVRWQVPLDQHVGGGTLRASAKVSIARAQSALTARHIAGVLLKTETKPRTCSLNEAPLGSHLSGGCRDSGECGHAMPPSTSVVRTLGLLPLSGDTGTAVVKTGKPPGARRAGRATAPEPPPPPAARRSSVAPRGSAACGAPVVRPSRRTSPDPPGDRSAQERSASAQGENPDEAARRGWGSG